MSSQQRTLTSKIWIVIYTDYDCTFIEKVYRTEEEAIQYMKRMGWYFYSAEEHKIDTYI